MKSLHGNISLPRIKVYREASEVGPVDLVVVAWKSTANAGFAKALPPLMGPDTVAATLQNGMGNAEEIAVLSRRTAFTWACASSAPCGRNRATSTIWKAATFNSHRSSRRRRAPAKAQELSALFAGAGIKTRAFDNAEQIQWYKLVWNIPFNGLCLALGGISIAELYKNPENVARVRRIMEEVVRAAKARGHTLPNDLVEFHLSRTESMGAFIPSSAVDYNEGRPIEYTAIWGDPLAKAHQAGASVPEWEQLDRDIRQRLKMD